MNRIVIANESASNADGASGLNAAARVHEIAIAAIVACGELDVALDIGRSAALADALSNGMYRLLPGRAHLPYLGCPDEIAALILTTLSNGGARTAFTRSTVRAELPLEAGPASIEPSERPAEGSVLGGARAAR